MPPVLLMCSTYAWYVACSTFGSTLMTKPMLAAPLTWNSVKPTFTGGLSLTGTVVPEPVAATVGPGLAVFVAAPEPAGVATALAAEPACDCPVAAGAALLPLAAAEAPSVGAWPPAPVSSDPPVAFTCADAAGATVRRSPTTNGSTRP